MVERYSITCDADSVRSRFSVDVPGFYKPHYNAAPTQLLPVITNTSPQGVSLFYWGIPPSWAKNKTVSEKVINLKAEALKEKPSLRRVILKRRCLIPADGFYAWKRSGKKTLIPYRIVAASGALLSFAGVWEDYEDNEGGEQSTFILLTRPADDSVRQITERIPVILSHEAEKVWLSAGADENALLDVLDMPSGEALSAYTVSPRINAISVDVPSLIAPAPPADQFGNLTLFD
jgi:putative SOS response-associated peptidase YedK